MVTTTSTPGADLERKITAVGKDLSRTVSAVIETVPGQPHGPVALARTLSVDKVLTSRVLKALRNKDAIAVINLTPGPAPLRRLLNAAARAGVESSLIDEAEAAVRSFEELIQREAGGRKELDSIISAWLPDARREFELRCKKAAFKAMSHMKGVAARTHVLSFILHPSDDGRHIDYVWLFGLLGLKRLRPGAAVHFASTRIAKQPTPARHALTLDRQPLDHLEGGLLEPFCSTPTPRLRVDDTGETVRYALADDGFGPKSAVDLICANLNPKGRRLLDEPGHRRLTSYYAHIRTPVQSLQFDMLLHEDVYPGVHPTLLVYDTSVNGTADVNDPSRDDDRYQMLESIERLGTGVARFRSADVPMYADLVQHVCARTGWDGSRFRGYRCRIDYPVHGSQVALAFNVPQRGS